MNLLKMNYIDELVYFRKHFMLNCNFIGKNERKENYYCTYAFMKKLLVY